MFHMLGCEEEIEKENKYINDMTPELMNTILTKQPREEAVKKHVSTQGNGYKRCATNNRFD